MKILCSVPKHYFYVCYISTLFLLQVLDFLFNGLILVPKTPCNWPIPDTKIPRFLGHKFEVVPWISKKEKNQGNELQFGVHFMNTKKKTHTNRRHNRTRFDRGIVSGAF